MVSAEFQVQERWQDALAKKVGEEVDRLKSSEWRGEHYRSDRIMKLSALTILHLEELENLSFESPYWFFLENEVRRCIHLLRRIEKKLGEPSNLAELFDFKYREIAKITAHDIGLSEEAERKCRNVHPEDVPLFVGKLWFRQYLPEYSWPKGFGAQD